MPLLIVIIVIGGIVWLTVKAMKLKRQQEADDRTFMGEHGGWDIYKSPYDRGLLALEHDRRLIAVGTSTTYTERPWSDISAVELERNGQSLTQTNRGSQIMGAAVGAALLGPVGLLMGGLSGSKRKKERVNELSLKVLIDDRTAPVHRVTFFRMKGNGVDAQSRVLKPSAAKLEHFHALLANAIRQDSRALAASSAQPALPAQDNADRIARLWELKQQGVITDEEFVSEKRMLLASGPSMSVLPAGKITEAD